MDYWHSAVSDQFLMASVRSHADDRFGQVEDIQGPTVLKKQSQGTDSTKLLYFKL